jgi:hypothetical protein
MGIDHNVTCNFHVGILGVEQRWEFRPFLSKDTSNNFINDAILAILQ